MDETTKALLLQAAELRERSTQTLHRAQLAAAGGHDECALWLRDASRWLNSAATIVSERARPDLGRGL